MKKISEIIVRDTIFFDLETTGTNISTTKIVELCAIKYKMDGTKEIMLKKFNPLIHISKEATAIHGFTNEELKDEPTFNDCATEIFNFFNGCDVGGFNSIKFDMAILYEEFRNSNIRWNYSKINMLDSFMLYNKCEPRTLEACYQKFCGKKLENAHSASADIEATIEVFEKQLEVYNLENTNLEDISKLIRSTKDNEMIVDLHGTFIKNTETGEFYYHEGKHKGKRVQDELGYLWYIATDKSWEKNVQDVAIKLHHKYTGEKLYN